MKYIVQMKGDDVVEGLQGSVLGSLGIPVSVSEIMNQRASSRREWSERERNDMGTN